MTTASSTLSGSDRTSVTTTSRRQLWAGRIVSGAPALLLLMSAGMKIAQAPSFLASWTGHLGFPAQALVPIGVLEVVCVALYLIPRTAVLGAILLTGYLGGAIATHVRIGEAFGIPLGLGLLVWLGLYLRETRLRALAPIRKPAT